MSVRGLTSAALLLAAWSMVACPRRSPPPPVVPGLSAAQLLRELRAQGAQRQQAVGRIHLDYLDSDGLFKGEADVAARRPLFLRFELRSFFGQNAAALSVDEQGFVFVDNGQQRAVMGPPGDPALRGVLPLGLAPADLVALLLASLPPLPPGSTRYMEPSQRGWLALRHESDAQTWLIEIDERDHALRRMRREQVHGEAWVELRIDRVEARAGQPFGMAGQARSQRMRGALRWRWQEVEINGPPLPPSAWRLDVPAGYRSGP